MEHLYQFFSHPQKWSEERIERGDWGIRADEAKMGCGGGRAGVRDGCGIGVGVGGAQGVVQRRICARLTFIPTLSIIQQVPQRGIFIRAPLNPQTFTPPLYIQPVQIFKPIRRYLHPSL